MRHVTAKKWPTKLNCSSLNDFSFGFEQKKLYRGRLTFLVCHRHRRHCRR